MRRTVKHVVRLTAGAMLACSAPQAGRAVDIACGQSFTTTAHVVTLGGTQTTSSTTAVDLPGATFSFTPNNRCLVIEVTGQVRAVGPNALRLSVVVSPAGEVSSPPFPAFRDVYSQTTALDGRSATFWVDLLEGDKDVKVQFMSVNGSPVSLSKGVVTFQYTPAP